jgi:hypothetical protein
LTGQISFSSPVLGPGGRFGGGLVERDRQFRDGIKQVVERYLDRQQRQEGQDQRRSGHREHVLEVRTQRHHDEFQMLPKARRPSPTPRSNLSGSERRPGGREH